MHARSTPTTESNHSESGMPQWTLPPSGSLPAVNLHVASDDNNNDNNGEEFMDEIATQVCNAIVLYTIC